MKFKISDIISKRYDNLHVEYSLDIKEINYLRDKLFINEPITLTGDFMRVGSEIMFSGRLKTITTTLCSRCLEEVTTDVEFEIGELITGTGDESDYDFIDLLIDEEVDLDAFIERLFILKQPTVNLCREDCNGLCPTCGTNLNDGSCGCDNDDIDLRMLKLKELLKQN